jgi:hypothetical protein
MRIGIQSHSNISMAKHFLDNHYSQVYQEDSGLLLVYIKKELEFEGSVMLLSDIL